MKKEEILKRVYSGASTYQECVLNHQYLFVFEVSKDNYQYVEIGFKKEQYQHLTGTWLDDVKSIDFFNRCIARRISVNDLKVSQDGTTDLKLDVLENAIRGIGKSSMIGIYDQSRVYLKTDRLIGGVSWCVGFVPASSHNSPLCANTLLKEDIRNISQGKPCRIIFGIEKLPGSKSYSKITKRVKDIDILSIIATLGITNRIDANCLNNI